MVSQFSDMASPSFFLRRSVSLVKFSYQSKSDVTGSAVMTIFFIRDRPEIQKSEIPCLGFTRYLKTGVS